MNSEIFSAFLTDNLSTTNVETDTPPKIASVCKNPECVREIEKHLSPIHTPTQTEEEVWNVKSLPSTWEPNAVSSKVVSSLIEKREAQHNAVLQELRTEMEKINLELEANLRLHAELLRHNILTSRKTVQVRLDNMSAEMNKPEVNQKVFLNGLLSFVENIHNKLEQEVEEFNQFVQDLEKERSEGVKRELRKAYKSLHEISYKLSYELQQFFEHEILKYNEAILSNLSFYHEVHLKLSLQIENDMRLWLLKIDECRETWRNAKKNELLSKLTESKLKIVGCQASAILTEQGDVISQSFVSKQNELNQIFTQMSLPYKMEDVDLWSYQLQDTVDGLVSSAKDLVQLYKMAIVHVFNGYFEDLQGLMSNMVASGLADDTDINVMDSEVCKSTVETVTQECGAQVSFLENLWSSVITELANKLQKTYKFLRESAHLWDSHFKRLTAEKEIVLKDVAKMIAKNNSAGQTQELKINIAIDTIRQASDQTTLDDALEDVIVLLDNLKKTYEGHYQSETKLFDKYYELVQCDIDVLVAELQLFLHLNPKESSIAPTSMRKRASQISLKSEDMSHFIPKQMKMCEYQVDAVHNWMFGLFEAIEKYTENCNQEIMDQAHDWVGIITKKLAKRFEVKLAMHQPRYARSRIRIYGFRLTEVQKHFDRLERHQAGVDNAFAVMQNDFSLFDNRFKNLVGEYHEKSASISEKLNTVSKSSSARLYLIELRTTSETYTKQINEITKNYEEDCEHRLKSINYSSIKFAKQIKLFSEMGNFNSDEAKTFVKQLIKIQKGNKKKWSTIIKQLNTKTNKILGQIEVNENETRKNIDVCLEEFAHNEQAETLLKTIQKHLVDAVCKSKVLMNRLDSNFTDLTDAALMHMADVDYVHDFAANFPQLISECVEINKYLSVKEFIVAAPTLTPPPEGAGKQPEQTKSGFADYLLLIFKKTPNDDATFMMGIYRLVYDSLKTIQNEAKDFYAAHSQIVNVECIQPTYSDFMGEIVEKYKYYCFQCEIIWLQHVTRFLTLFYNLQKFIFEYYDAFLETYYNNTINRFKKEQRNFIQEATALINSNINRIKAVHHKLKPLHGYPKNKNLLDELEVEMAETLNATTEDTTLFERFQQDQEGLKQNSVEQLLEIEPQLRTLRDDYFNAFTISNLKEKSQEFLNSIQKLLVQGSPEMTTESVERLADQILNLKLPDEYQTCLESNKSVLLEGINVLNFVDSATFNSESSSVSIYIERIEYEFEYNVVIMDEKRVLLETLPSKWSPIWRNDVENVLKLYTVKYEILREENLL